MSDSTKVDVNVDNAETNDDDKGANERTFTQSEVEAMMRGRLAKFADYDDIKKRLAETERASQSEQERAVADARAEARAEALAEVNKRIVSAEARALAAEMHFLYPQDAALYIDAASIKVNDDGTVDADAIKAALSEAIKDRPALVKSDEKQVPTPSNAGIGVRGDAKPSTPEAAWLRDVSGT